MEDILFIGLLVMAGYLLGELVQKVSLPKVSGYVIAGLLLNPTISILVPENFDSSSSVIVDICLAFITFEVGGTLLFSKLRSSGPKVLGVTCAEALGAALVVFLGFVIISSYWAPEHIVALSVLLAALAAPTDPSATLAVMHEYKAKGEVSTTIMEVAAFDDALGIIIFSLAIGVASVYMQVDAAGSLLIGGISVIVGISIGVFLGFVFNQFTSFFNIRGDQTYIVLVLGFLCLCYGTAVWLNGDALLSTMTMGMMVVNFNVRQKEIFDVLARYTENLVFIFFFTLSARQLDMGILKDASLFVVLFVILRAIGKYAGTYLGATMTRMSLQVRTLAAGGLIPQGGVVIGLALTLEKNSALTPLADLVISTVIGATVVHELIGPVIAKITLKKAGEIPG